MSAHTECGRVGKFDCWQDERINELIENSGDPGEGDVESPVAWFTEFDLDPHEPGDVPLMEHYGSEWLIARQLNDGRWFVEVYPTLADRDDRMDALRHGLEAWDSAEFDQI